MVNEIERLQKEKLKSISKGLWKDAASSCNCMGSMFNKLGQFQEALECHQEELELSVMQGDQLDVAVANRMIGECYCELYNFKKALLHIKKFLDIAVSLGFSVEQQRAWATLGRTYLLKYYHDSENGKNEELNGRTLDQAEQSFLRALELSESLKSNLSSKEYAEMRARLLLNLGLVYQHRDRLTQCAESIQHAIFLAKKYNLTEDLNRCQQSLASVYQSHGQYTYALRLWDGAIASAKLLQNKTLKCEALYAKALILILLKDFEGGKAILKQAYKLNSPIENDHKKTIKTLRICVGICNTHKILQNLNTDEYNKRKYNLEKIADGLSSIECYKLAIEFYFSTLECMEASNQPLSERAPIYFSLAQTYADDGNMQKAIEYFNKELECNKGKPSEQVKTLWKISEINEVQSFTELEKVFNSALSLAEVTGDNKLIRTSLEKMISFYKINSMTEKVEELSMRLESFASEDSSDEDLDVENNSEPFDDICLSEMSGLSDSEVEKEMNDGTRAKSRVKKLEIKVNEKGETPLHQACINGNFTMVKRFIESGHPINTRDNSGWLPLHEACNYGFYDIVEYLLEKGAFINDRGGSLCGGITPLHDAASCGNLDVMQLLIAKGASVTSLDDNGESPLDALIHWKKRMHGDLDSATLKLCKVVEGELKLKMKQSGQLYKQQPEDNISPLDEVYSAEFTPTESKTDKQNDKRSRSPSISSETDSDDSHSVDFVSSNLTLDREKDWDNANEVQSEYQKVMSNLRRSAKNIEFEEYNSSLIKKPRPSLLDENDVVSEWLIKDTGKIIKSKKKRRKISKLNIRTSKSLNNYLIPKETTNDAVGKDNEILIENFDSDHSTNSNVSTKQDCGKQSNKLREETDIYSNARIKKQRQSFCLKVRIANKLILVPVIEEDQTIGWLANEAAERYQILVGNRPHLTLLTKDGALLSNSDLIKTILCDNQEVLSSVEHWDEPSLEERYVQACSKRGIAYLSSIKKKLLGLEATAELNFNDMHIPPSHLSSVFISLSNYDTLQYLSMGSTSIGDANIGLIISCFQSFVSLISLDLSCCCLTSVAIQHIVDYLDTQKEPCYKLPKLRFLNLSFNMFGSDSASLFGTLLSISSLISLDLSSCNLESSFFKSSRFRDSMVKSNLHEFCISGNVLEASGIIELLSEIPKQTIKKLDLSRTVSSNIQFGQHLAKFISQVVPNLTFIILQGCHLNDDDLIHASKFLSQCPQLQLFDVSANPEITSQGLCEFVMAAHRKNVPLKSLFATGTHLLEYQSVCHISDIFNFKLLMHVKLDCKKEHQTILLDAWKNCWGAKATALADLFCELNVM